MSDVTPEDVMRLTKPTDGFLCTLAANSYGIEFLSFVISDYETKNVIFEVTPPAPCMLPCFCTLSQPRCGDSAE